MEIVRTPLSLPYDTTGSTMAIPRQKDLELPLLRAIAKLGGKAKPAQIYPLLEKDLALSAEDKAERVSGGGLKWTNRVQWARQELVVQGEIDSTQHGVWALTDKGRARAAMKGAGAPIAQTPADLSAIWDSYEAAYREKTLDRLLQLEPYQFEHFAKEFLSAYGFVELHVTQASKDGGIDGYGKLKVGVASMQVAFQCKRWQGTVGRPEIDKFRGAIQGEFEQGIFFTTSEFSKSAADASIKKGAVPVILIDGEELVRIMIEKSIGVSKRPLYLFEDIPIAGVDEPNR